MVKYECFNYVFTYPLLNTHNYLYTSKQIFQNIIQKI